MKKVRTILLTGVLTMGVFSTVIYSSCSKKDKCDGIVCKNGGSCDDGACKCPLGYEGANCETASANKFIGLFATKDNCPLVDSSRGSLNYSVTINAGPSATQLYVLNMGNPGLPPSDYLTATMTSKDELTIQPKTLSDNRTYSGTIKYVSAGKLTASFQVSENGNTIEACSSTMTK
ncbi:MAG TPA: calcium-binding EGF-like domain-containing protein [Edaphocola sp.]|nr:calcium-binding EGF-like domain-containing protein [Edaphocola sp.]